MEQGINSYAASEMSEKDLMTVETQYWADKLAALQRLEKNEDFNNLILTGYLKDKAVNGVSMLAAPHVKRNGFRPDVMESLVAISQLENYFMTVKNLCAAPADEDTEEGEVYDA